jgi:hypothetical protein
MLLATAASIAHIAGVTQLLISAGAVNHTKHINHTPIPL